jgi:ATP-dependent Clp protease ATP-binding subunit ClpA
MGRLVQEKIKQPLAEELLFGKLINGGEVKVRIKDNIPSFEITPAPPKAVKAKGGKSARPKRDDTTSIRAESEETRIVDAVNARRGTKTEEGSDPEE